MKMKHEPVTLTADVVKHDGRYYYFVCPKCGKKTEVGLDKRHVGNFFICYGNRTSRDIR